MKYETQFGLSRSADLGRTSSPSPEYKGGLVLSITEGNPAFYSHNGEKFLEVGLHKITSSKQAELFFLADRSILITRSELWKPDTKLIYPTENLTLPPESNASILILGRKLDKRPFDEIIVSTVREAGQVYLGTIMLINIVNEQRIKLGFQSPRVIHIDRKKVWDEIQKSKTSGKEN